MFIKLYTETAKKCVLIYCFNCVHEHVIVRIFMYLHSHIYINITLVIQYCSNIFMYI